MKTGLMSRMISKLFPIDNRGGSRGAWTSIVREPFQGAWQRNIQRDTDSVLAHHAVYACITLLANDFGKLRHKLTRESENGIWSEVSNPAYSPVLRRPNKYQNQIQFRQWWLTSKLIRGNTYALKVRDARGVVTGLYLLDTSRVMVMVAQNGDVYYQLGSDNLSGITTVGLTVPASEIIHDRMNCLFHPLCGISPLFAAGAVACLGLDIQENSSKFFGNNSRPGGILTAPGSITNDTAQRLKTYFEENFTGVNAGKIAVVGDSLKYEPMAISAADSQLIEQFKWTSEVICSVFHVPGYKIGVGTMPAYNNIGALGQDYYNTALQSPIEEYEACMNEGLGLPENMGVELDLTALLRMDQATQMTTLRAGVEGRIMTIDEARLAINLPPVDGGDSIWSQQQYYSLSALAARDAAGPPAPVNGPHALPPPITGPDVPPPEDPPAVDPTAKALELLWSDAA